MKKIVGMGLVLMCGLSLAACGEQKTEKKGSATAKTEETSKSTESTEKSSSESEGDKLEEGVEARNVFKVDWTEDWHNTTFQITDVSLVEYNDQQSIDALDTKFIAGVKFVVENKGDHKITTYPDQGKVVINGKQYDANMFVSDDVGGDVMNGSKIEGVVAYPIKDITSIDEVKSIRVVWTASDFENVENIDDTSKDFDVDLQLNK